MEQGYSKDDRNAYKEDLETLITITNKRLITKKLIEDEFRVNGVSPFLDQKGNKCSLLRMDLIFENDTLVKIIPRDH
jgi:hypothetical protein